MSECVLAMWILLPLFILLCRISSGSRDSRSSTDIRVSSEGTCSRCSKDSTDNGGRMYLSVEVVDQGLDRRFLEVTKV